MTSNANAGDAVAAMVDARDVARTEASVLARMFGVASAPTRIGRYQLEGSLGEGAMGHVYAAHDPRLGRRVALKLLRSDGSNAPDATRRRRRLVDEAKAAAQLSHANVVEVFEVGTDGDEVYIAMELVEGKTLRQWRDRDAPSAEQIIAAFVAAGQGLQAAHEAGIVHRDFKPDNVLVGDDGRIKVADFGLALGGPESSGHGPVTATSSGSLASSTDTNPGTPAYMAVEVLIGQRASARSDQFSFSVALAEILTGARVRSAAKLPTATIPPRAVNVLRRGLSDEPEERFESMAALLDELRDGTRGTKRLALGAGLVGFVGVAAAVAVTGTDPPACDTSAAIADKIWSDERAEALASILAEGNVELGAQTWERAEPELREYVDGLVKQRDAACLAARRAGAPAVFDRTDACVREQLRKLDRVVGAFESRDAGALHFVAAVAGLRGDNPCDADGPGEIELERAADLTEMTRVRIMLDAGNEAGREIAEGIRDRALVRGDTLVVATVDMEVGRWLADSGHRDEGLRRLESAYFDAAAVGEDDIATQAAIARADLEISHDTDIVEARVWLEHATTHHQRSPSPRRNVDLARLRARLAYVAGDHDEALREAELALERLEALPVPPAGPKAVLMRLRAKALGRLGRMADRRAAMLAASELLNEAFGPGHPQALSVYGDLGVIHAQAGRYEEARQHLAVAVRGLEVALGAGHPKTASHLSSLGAMEGKLGRYERARESLQRAHEIMVRSLGAEHPSVASSLLNLSEAEKELGDLTAAIAHRRQAAEIMRSNFGERAPAVLNILSELASLYTRMGRNDDAIALLHQVIEASEVAPSPGAKVRRGAYLALSRAVSGDDVTLAIAHLRTAMELIEDSVGTMHSEYAVALTNLAALLVLDGRPAEALEPARQALVVYDEALGPDHPDLAYTLIAAANAEIARGLFEEALPHARRALVLREASEGIPEYLIARAQIVVARSLWPSDASRAEVIAADARATLETLGEDGVPGLEELDEWVASRGSG